MALADNQIGNAIAIHVIDAHLGAAAAERCRMEGPGLLGCAAGRLFPPTAGVDDIHASIAVNVSDAHPVSADADPL